MSTFTQIYYHVVFSTKDRVPVLAADKREKLFRYAWGILKNKDCHLYRINGVEDHVHILTSLHPTVCLADLVKEVKVSTSSGSAISGPMFCTIAFRGLHPRNNVREDLRPWKGRTTNGSALSGPDRIPPRLRGLHPRLFKLFASGEPASGTMFASGERFCVALSRVFASSRGIS